MEHFALNPTEPEQTPTPTPTPNADTEVKANTGILQSDIYKDLCLQLIHAETEDEVKSILRRYGYWDDSNEYWDEPKDWSYFGDNANSWATAGNQSSRPDYALVEKLTNSIDHVLLRECKIKNIPTEGTEQDGTPQTMQEAVKKFFNVPEGKIAECVAEERAKLAEEIKLIATGSSNNPCYIIADNGEGQPPEELPNTLLAFGKSNKLKVPFVQGKFNMGGLAIFRFCNFQLILSRQNPLLSKKLESENAWGFTIIYRKRSSSERERSSSIRYLAPEGKILSFVDDSLPILPGTYPESYEKPMKSGTFIKLYNYELQGYKTVILRDLYYRLSLLLEGTCLPIRFYERRKDYHKGKSHQTTLSGLQVRLENARGGGFSDNLECEPIPINFSPILGQKIKGKCYVFKEKGRTSYAKTEGVIFSLNGQSHGDLADSFFNRQGIGLGTLAGDKSLLVVLDCTSISYDQRENLLMNSRDRIAKSEISKRIQDALKEWLANHQGLKMLNAKRRAEQDNDKLADNKPLQDILKKVLKQSPVLYKLLLQGQRLSNPDPTIQEKPILELKKFPTYFELEKQYPREKTRKHSKDTVTVSYKTNAENDYFERVTDAGEITLYVNDQPYDDFSINLWEGKGTLRIYTDSDWKLGQVIEVTTKITDIDRTQPFVETFFIEREEPSVNPSGSPSEPKSGFDIPKAEPIEKDKWDKHLFNKYSALKVAENDGEYYYYVNVDNIHLKTEQKYSKNSNVFLENQYISAMVLIGLALLQEDKEKQNNAEDESQDTRDRDIFQEIAETTKNLSMVLLPMINGLGNLSKEQDGE